MKQKYAVAAAVLAGAIAVPAMAAAQDVFVTTDLNLRAGPGSDFPVVTTITSRQTVVIYGCTEARRWCEVEWGGQRGWAYADYLGFDYDDEIVIISDAAGDWIDLPVVAYQPDDYAAAPYQEDYYEDDGWTTAVGGPFEPPARVRTYVIERSYDPIYVEEEIVLGEWLPEHVELYPVPEYDYHYAFVNDYRVLADPYTREVVYIFN